MIMELLISIWNLAYLSAPYLIAGFFIAGLIKALIKDEWIYKVLGKEDSKTVVLSSIIGAPLPICSCGVVPVVQGLRKQGAGRGASISFLVSTPETGADSVALTYAMMGPVMAVVRPVVAVFTAIIAGLAETFMSSRYASFRQEEEVKSCCAKKKKEAQEKKGCCPSMSKKPSIFARIKAGLSYSFVDLLRDISKNLLLGFVLGGLITMFIPPDLMNRYFSGSFLGLVAMVFVATPLYICATSSTPIAAAMMLQGMSPGTALVFLMAGPATNAASLTVLVKLFGRKSIILYLSVIVSVSIASALVLDSMIAQGWFQVQVSSAMKHDHHHEMSFLQLASTVLLLLACVWYAFLAPLMKKNSNQNEASEGVTQV